MAALETYILRLLAGSILCAVVLRMVPEKPYEGLLRSLSGIFLTLLMLEPLGNLSWDLELDCFEAAGSEGENHSAYGADMAKQEQLRCISEELEAYILDKAGREGESLKIDVILGADFLPERVELQGECEEPARQYLTELIETELGIAKENQVWTG